MKLLKLNKITNSRELGTKRVALEKKMISLKAEIKELEIEASENAAVGEDITLSLKKISNLKDELKASESGFKLLEKKHMEIRKAELIEAENTNHTARLQKLQSEIIPGIVELYTKKSETDRNEQIARLEGHGQPTPIDRISFDKKPINQQIVILIQRLMKPAKVREKILPATGPIVPIPTYGKNANVQIPGRI